MFCFFFFFFLIERPFSIALEAVQITSRHLMLSQPDRTATRSHIRTRSGCLCMKACFPEITYKQMINVIVINKAAHRYRTR
uniref:Putative secreted protein synganglion overexpressed n=1 Tax=Rhipicephalus microplus TaxID=6941 RepID=A0A6M2DDH1_RHIMP